jgi:hypothetical protein
MQHRRPRVRRAAKVRTRPYDYLSLLSRREIRMLDCCAWLM